MQWIAHALLLPMWLPLRAAGIRLCQAAVTSSLLQGKLAAALCWGNELRETCSAWSGDAGGGQALAELDWRLAKIQAMVVPGATAGAGPAASGSVRARAVCPPRAPPRLKAEPEPGRATGAAGGLGYSLAGPCTDTRAIALGGRSDDRTRRIPHGWCFTREGDGARFADSGPSGLARAAQATS